MERQIVPEGNRQAASEDKVGGSETSTIVVEGVILTLKRYAGLYDPAFLFGDLCSIVDCFF